jgi:elongation factor G
VLHDAAEDAHIHLKPLQFPVPVHGLAISPKRRGDEQRLHDILLKVVSEDPCLRVEHVASTNETVVYGLGELHLRTLLDRPDRGAQLPGGNPAAAHRLPRDRHRAGRGPSPHKKQTGGAGQFGEVFLRIEPLPRGTGFQFVDEVKGGAIPHNFMPAVEKGVLQAMEEGVIAGYPVVDLKCVVYDGKHHTVDSKEIAFISAGKKALITAVQSARPCLLEPIVDVEISRPRPTWATSRRPGGAARPRGRHPLRQQRIADGAGQGTAVGTVELPVAAEFADGRAGPLHHRVQPLRAGAPRRADAVGVAIQAQGRRLARTVPK